MLIRLLLLTKSFRRSLLDYFISKVVYDLFSFGHEVLANGPHLRYFLPNLLLRMCRTGHRCPSGINIVQN